MEFDDNRNVPLHSLGFEGATTVSILDEGSTSSSMVLYLFHDADLGGDQVLVNYIRRHPRPESTPVDSVISKKRSALQESSVATDSYSPSVKLPKITNQDDDVVLSD